MNDSPQTRTLRDYLRVLRSHSRLVIGSTLVALVVALAYAAIKEPTYEATATLGVRVEGEPAAQSFQPQQAAAANAKVVTSQEVATAAQESLGSNLTTDELRNRVTAEVQTQTGLVAITAEDPSAGAAADIANAFARETRIAVRERARVSYSAAADRLRRQLGESDPTTEEQLRDSIKRLTALSTVVEPVEILSLAEVPSSPASPKPLQAAGLAALLGLLLGVGAAFVRDSLDRRLTDPHEIQHQLGIPLLGYVREDMLGRAMVVDNGARGFSEDDLEAFRILRRNVDFLVKEGTLRALAVTSGVPEEGKSTVAACFAYASALAGRRTLLVECDFRRPVLARRLEIDETPGLSDYLRANGGDVQPVDILRPLPVQGPLAAHALPVIPAGESISQPAEMIASERFHHFLSQVTRAYDLVVLDTAPILPVGDTLELLPQVDGVLLCVRLGQTTRDQADAASAAMAHLPEKPIGLVVTGIRPGSEDDYYGYYSHAPRDRAGASA